MAKLSQDFPSEWNSTETASAVNNSSREAMSQRDLALNIPVTLKTGAGIDPPLQNALAVQGSPSLVSRKDTCFLLVLRKKIYVPFPPHKSSSLPF